MAFNRAETVVIFYFISKHLGLEEKAICIPQNSISSSIPILNKTLDIRQCSLTILHHSEIVYGTSVNGRNTSKKTGY